MMVEKFKFPVIKIAMVVFIIAAIILLPVMTFANMESANEAGQEATLNSVEDDSMIMANNLNGANNYDWPDDPEFAADDLYLLFLDFNYEGSTNDHTIAYAFWFHEGELFVAVAMNPNKNPVLMKLNDVPVESNYYKVYASAQSILTINPVNNDPHQKAAEDAAKHPNSKWLVMNFGEVTLAQLQTQFKLTVTTTGVGHHLGDDGTVFIVLTPALTLTKEADPNTYDAVGQEITYTFTVLNTGNATLEDVTVEDPLFDVDFDAGTLGPNEYEEFTYVHTITQADLDEGSIYNVAAATGKLNGVEYSDTDDETVTAEQNALIAMTKKATSVKSAAGKEYGQVNFYAVGDVITYTFTVTNIGNVTLTDVMIDDPALDLEDLPVSPLTLKPGEVGTATETWEVTQANIDAGKVENTATAKGLDPNEGEVTATDHETVTHKKPVVPSASIKVTKSVSVDGGATWDDANMPTGPSTLVGSTVQFKFVVKNTGNVTLTDLTLTDDTYSLSGATLPASLAPGNSFEYILDDVKAKAGQQINEATATGMYGKQTLKDTDKAHYYGIYTVKPVPSIAVTKYVSVDGGTTWHDANTPTGPSTLVGSTVQFKFVVKNTGNVTLTDLTLTDDTYSLTGVTVPVSLAPGNSFEYILDDVKAKAGQQINEATATGMYGKQTLKDTDKAHYYGKYTVKPTPAPSIAVTKYVSVDGGTTWHDAKTGPGPATVIDSKVQFKFVVKNTGNVTLTGLTLTDDTYSLTGVTVPVSLAPGKSFEYILDNVKAKAGQQVNKATATGMYEKQTLSDSDKAHYYGKVPDKPSIEVKKYVSVDGALTWHDADTARGPNVLIDSKVQFKFIVKNTGNVTLTGLTLSDDTYSLTGVTVPASLAPGKSFEYILDNVKAKAGQHSNTATATGRYEKQTFRDTDKAHYYGYQPDKPPAPKPAPTPPTGGDTVTALIIALFLLIFASIGLRKALLLGVSGRTGKKY